MVWISDLKGEKENMKNIKPTINYYNFDHITSYCDRTISLEQTSRYTGNTLGKRRNRKRMVQQNIFCLRNAAHPDCDHVLCLFVTLNDPKKKNIHKKPMALIFWLVPVISLLANCSTYLIALGVDFSIEIFISALIGVFFIVLGNYMPKLQQNYTIGIKLPWTLNSEENWNRTHRLGGKLYIVMGIAMILMSFIDSLLGSEAAAWIILSVITIGAIIPAAYSFYLYKKGI